MVGTVLILSFIFVFIPNSVFELFANFAVVVSAAFLILQTLMLVDFGQLCNDQVFETGISARRVSMNSDYVRAAKIVLVVVSAMFLLGAIAGYILLGIGFEHGWAVGMTILVVCLALLVVSITEWCEHGNLFCSSLVTLYCVWVSYEVLVTDETDYIRPDFAKWIGIIIAVLTLAASILGSGLGLGGQEPMLGGGSEDEPNATSFAIQAGLHALAALYVATALAPSQSTVGFISRIIALVGCVLLYTWILVAPKVLTDRF
jgi:hypothetical protein